MFLDRIFLSMVFLFSLYVLLNVACPVKIYADTIALVDEAEAAFKKKDFPGAEGLFLKALQEEPDNLKAMQLLAETKAALGKYEEAEKILARILAIPVASGRHVMVTLEGAAEPLEAEVVDENVFALIQSKEFLKNNEDPADIGPVPQYRLFFKKTGQVRLIPKSHAKLKYTGITLMLHEKMQFLLTEVRREMLAAGPKTQKTDDMVDIKGGCFIMGDNQSGHPDESPEHEVCVTSFKLDKYEVTQNAYLAKMGNNPSRFVGGKLPVDSVMWEEAVEYCGKSGKRLPTEAEWEYAARAGTKTQFYTGDKFVGKDGNFCDKNCTLNLRDINQDDGFKFTAPVGSFSPNPFGLYDMSGNLAEWVSDWLYENYYQISPKDNPQGPSPQDSKVFRGGSWSGTVEMVRSARRMGLLPEYRHDEIGFRCAAGS